MKQSILTKFNLTESDLLGSGGESWVYRLDNERILRIAKGDASKRWYLETSKRFYDTLPKMDFAFPVISSIEEHDGSIVSIENKIAGKPLSKILSNLSTDEKQKALTNYLTAVETLKNITYSDLPYGEMLTKNTITSQTWSITKDIYDKKHQEYADKLQLLNIELEEYTDADFEYQTTLTTVLDVARRAKTIFENCSEPREKRVFLKMILQNPTVQRKKLHFSIASPFNLVLELSDSPDLLRGQDSVTNKFSKKIFLDPDSLPKLKVWVPLRLSSPTTK